MLFIACLLAALPQESALRYDAGQVVLGPTQPLIKRLLHIDSDGFPDAVGLRHGDGGTVDRTDVGVFFGNGTGGFEELWTLSILGPSPSLEIPMVTGDFDGDGDADFATSVGDQVFVFLCDERTEPQVQPPITLGGPNVTDMEARDFDGDGRDDIVAITDDFSTRSVNVALSPQSWAPSFANFHSLPRVPGGLALFEKNGAMHAAVTWATLAPDNDLVVGEFELSTGAPIPGLVHVLPTMSVQLEAPSLGGGDIDGDGDDDVVAFAEGEYWVLRSNGSSLSVEAAAVGGSATDLFDVDGDGDLDGVSCGGSPSSTQAGASVWEIALNDGTGAFAPSYEIPCVAGTGWAGADDVDGDGDQDLVAGRTVYFDRGDSYATGLNRGVEVNLGTGGFSDADGDGDMDINVSLQGTVRRSYYENDGSGGFSLTVCPTFNLPVLTNPPNAAGVGDFDGDGDLDLIVTFYLPSTGRTTFLATNVAGTYHYPSQPMALAFPVVWEFEKKLSFDWDNDGDVDYLNTEARAEWPMSLDRTYVMLNQGAGEFTPGPYYVRVVVMDRADLDGDGLKDFIVGEPQGVGVRRALPFGGFGAFQALPVVCKPKGPIAIADLDEDGDLDIASFELDGVTPVIFRNNGNASFTASDGGLAAIPTPGDSLDPGWYATDFDGDERVDLILSPGPTTSYSAVLYRNDQSGVLGFTEHIVQALTSARPLDVDMDGDEDLVGEYIHTNLRFEASDAGSAMQYGERTEGSGGIAPRLGVSNSVDVLEYAKFHISGVRGGLVTHFAFSLSPAELSNFPVAGVTAYLDPTSVVSFAFPMPGPPVDGEGSIVIPVFIPPSLAGVNVYHQVFASDAAAPGGLAASNALRVTYGSL